jgi:Fe-S cluster assembly ATP-binding protein
MLVVHSLTCIKEEKLLLRACFMHGEPGSIVGLIGPNGAGKTTLGKVMTGLDGYNPSAGSFIINNTNFFALSAAERARAGFWYVPPQQPYLDGVTIFELLYTSYCACKKIILDRISFYTTIIQPLSKKYEFITPLLERYCDKTLSRGEYKRCELFFCALIQPKYIFFDEIDAALDNDMLCVARDLINELKHAGACIIIVSHVFSFLCSIKLDSLYSMHDGVLSPADIEQIFCKS